MNILIKLEQLLGFVLGCDDLFLDTKTLLFSDMPDRDPASIIVSAKGSFKRYLKGRA
jgi:hypothetical protein